MAIRLLLADNKETFLKQESAFLERQGYTVFTAKNPKEAISILNNEKIDVALLDMRLIDDDDTGDISGIQIARDIQHDIPKIIVSLFADFQTAREALGTRLTGLPPSVDFISKEEENFRVKLISAINQARIKLDNNFSINKEISTGIQSDYNDVRTQQWMYFVAGFVSSLIGIGFLYFGIYNMFSDNLALGLIQGAAGILASSATILFFKRTDIATKRMDQYHRERISIDQLENLILVSDDIDDDEQRIIIKREIITAVSKYWFSVK